jgi:surface polysaccharide O-acyltransferase-like enzyme
MKLNFSATQYVKPGMSAPAREYGLDFLRVAAFGVLIFYHSGMGFVSWDWHVKNNETSPLLEHFMLLFNRWRLPLLFFISGCGVYFSLRRRSFLEFSSERIRRLFIPVLFGIFVTVPPQIYFERLRQGVPFATYWDFYKTVFDFVPYRAGNTSWHHLWFVVYILVHSLVGIPLFAWLRGERGRQAVAAFANFIARHPKAFYLINLPSLAAGYTLGPRFPTTNALVGDWANLTGTFITFAWGFVIASSPALLDTIERRRKEFLTLAVVLQIFFYWARLSGADLGPAGRSFVNGWLGFLWIFALVGLARAGVKHGGEWLARANEAVYPFYIIHQTVTVAAVYALASAPLNLWLKLALVMAATFLGSYVFYESMRRTALTRLLIGLRP